MRLNPHLEFDGQCAAAFAAYAACLGGRVATQLTLGESPMAAHAPPEQHGRILHATFEADGLVLTGADVPPERYAKPQGFSVLLNVDGAGEAARIFAALAAGGEVHLPLQETFWALRFGMLVDRFGVPWMLNCARAGT